MSDILPTCAHLHPHPHTHTHWQGTYYTHTCTHVHIYIIHNVMYIHTVYRKVYSTLLVISPFPCTMGSWASAAFGGSALVGKMLFWQGKLLWQLTSYRWSGQCECAHFDVRLSTSYVHITRPFHFTLEPQGRGVGGTYILRMQCVNSLSL